MNRRDLFVLSLPYPQYFGGVSALTPDQYLKMNGFPNEYWGWGGEDDDIFNRLVEVGQRAGWSGSEEAQTGWGSFPFPVPPQSACLPS